jgi:chromosome partitioning protein
MKIVTLAQLKGGSAKTTTAVHLAVALARHARVLLVDTDHQAAATELLTAPGAPPARGTLAVLLEGAAVAEVAAPTRWGVDVVAAAADLARAELALAARIGREAVLRAALRAAPDRWDYCLIDTPPSIGLMTANALVATDALLAPVAPAYLSLKALAQLEATVEMVRALNPAMEHLGYLLCLVDGRDRVSAEARAALRQYAGAALWPKEVRFDVRFKSRFGDDALRGRGAEDYVAVATELRRRLGEPPSRLPSRRAAQPAAGLVAK